MKKQSKTLSKVLVGGLIAVCLIISSVGYAMANQGSLSDRVAQIAGTILGNSLVDEIGGTNELSLGYVGDTPTYLTDKRPGTLVTYSNIYTPGDFEVGGMSYLSNITYYGSPTITGTSTPSVTSYYPIRVAVDYVASTTLNLSADDGNPLDAIAEYTNSGAEKICTVGIYDAYTGTGTWTYSYGMGTTTATTGGSWTNTTTATLIASTTAANTFDYDLSSYGYMTTDGNPGSYYTINPVGGKASTTAFVLNNGESVILWYKPITATSSDSFVAGDGHNATGYMLLNCRAR